MLLESDCGSGTLWFTDDTCFMTPQKNMVFANMVCLGYLFYDFLVQVFLVKAEGNTAKQMILHHVLGVFGVTSSTICGYAMPGINTLVLSVEISTIFINYRVGFDRHQMGQPAPMVI